MSKQLNAILVLCVTTISLSGCAYFRATGPCLGVGCPAHTIAQTATSPRVVAANVQASSGVQARPAPEAASAQPQTTQAKASASNRFTRFFARLIPRRDKTAKPGAAAD